MVNGPLRLVFDVADARLQAAIEACEADVFTQYFGNTAQDLAREYGPYPGAHWLAFVDDDDEVAAASRLFLPSAVRSKTMDDVAEQPWGADPDEIMRAAGIDPAVTADFATFAVRPGIGKSGLQVSKALMYGWFAVMRANGCRTLTLMIDEVPDRILKAAGLFFHTMPGTRAHPYLGSPSTRPGYAHLDEMLRVQRETSPGDHRLIAQGLGFEGILLPPVSYFAVDPQDEQLPA